MQLITSAQTLTDSWADLGGEQDMSKYKRCMVWLNIDINDSQNVRVRAVGKLSKNAANEYNLPIKTTSSSQVTIQDEFMEFNDDADQKVLLEIVTNGLIPFVQLQVEAGTVGASAGQIDEADITFSNL